MPVTPGNAFDHLWRQAARKDVDVVIAVHRGTTATKKVVRIEAFKERKLIDYEWVQGKESLLNAAARMYSRMKRERVVE